MAPSEQDVEQSLSSRAVLPIAQLDPNLSDQATRKIQGEVTITWPYSSVTKSFAFLLAESDFRLRRHKGLVRIQLQGPSAEAVGKWELGSGDQVTLGLDGVEWAKDDEPARTAGSRSEWQLKFVGKLVLKATLGEPQETKFLSIDQPIPVEPPETTTPIPLAEIDPTIFDAPLVSQKPPTPPAPSKGDEFASPMFTKRSRASYGPLFELDLDDELEDDGGRKGMGRKRPRYSALNGVWRLHEDNSSPEPEEFKGALSAAGAQTQDVEMHDTPTRPGMVDGGVQTIESNLAPVPSSPLSTPSKTWSEVKTSSFSDVAVPQPNDASRTDSGAQSSSRPVFPDPTERHENASPQPAPNPFGHASQASGFAVFEYPQGPSQNQGYGNASSLFGTAATEAPIHDFGGASQLVGSTSDGPSSQVFGETSLPFGTVSHVPASQGLGQSSSLFGIDPAPSQSHFPEMSNANTGFGAMSGSLRFGFGQEPQSTFGAVPFENTQAPVQPPADPYPESSLDRQEPLQYPPSASHNPFNMQDGYGLEAPVEETASKEQIPVQGVSLWPKGFQSLHSSHPVDQTHNVDRPRSDGSDSEGTPPGMVPPGVDDGTRNVDDMRQEAILSQPVYRQDVPPEALPGQDDASAGEEDDTVDSDEQAVYDDAEKGDDYDLRNYDRVSDDEEGFDDGEPFSDDELLDQGSEHWAGAEAEEGYEEDDYDEDEENNEDYNVSSQAPRLLARNQLAPQPAAQREKVVIDLLSDSDDDAPSAPPVTSSRSQIPQNEFACVPQSGSAGFSRTESVDEQGDQVPRTGRPLPIYGAIKQDSRADPETDVDEEAGDYDDEDGEFSDDEHFKDDGDEPEPDSELAESNEEEPEMQEAITVNRIVKTYRQPVSFNGAMDLDNDEQDVVANEAEDEADTRDSSTERLSDTDHQPDSDSGHNIMAVDDSEPVDPTESFQTQPDEMIASFRFQAIGATSLSQPSESHKSSDVGSEDDFDQEAIDSVGDGEPRQGASDSHRAEDPERAGAEEQPAENVRLLDVSSEQEGEESAPQEATGIDDPETRKADVSSSRQDKAAASSIFQPQEVHSSSLPAVENDTATITSHVETQLSNKQVTFETQETELQAELVLSQPMGMDMVNLEEGTDRESPLEEKDVTMTEAEVTVENHEKMWQVGMAQPPADKDSGRGTEAQGPPPSEMMREPLKDEIDEVSPPLVRADVRPDQTAGEVQQIADETLNHQGDHDEDLPEGPEMDEQVRESPVGRAEDGFASTDSQPSQIHNATETGTAPTEKAKRDSRKTRPASSSKSAKSAPASQSAHRQSSRQSSRQVSAQQVAISQRTTRSKTMSFQAASPKEDKEDMSIQLARAALKSPTSKKRKVSATAGKRLNTDLVRRLENDLPDCVSLSDLRKYNANFVDVAAVATSANAPPKRTPTREYASSFTITDPSFAHDGVVEVDLYSLHKDHLPVVKTGDSILLRGFLVVSLPDRGFGLKTKDGSAWAVFKAGGDDQPEMNAAIVEMNDKEAKFMLDVRAWYASLNDTAKGRLVAAVGKMMETEMESRVKK